MLMKIEFMRKRYYIYHSWGPATGPWGAIIGCQPGHRLDFPCLNFVSFFIRGHTLRMLNPIHASRVGSTGTATPRPDPILSVPPRNSIQSVRGRCLASLNMQVPAQIKTRQYTATTTNCYCVFARCPLLDFPTTGWQSSLVAYITCWQCCRHVSFPPPPTISVSALGPLLCVPCH